MERALQPAGKEKGGDVDDVLACGRAGLSDSTVIEVIAADIGPRPSLQTLLRVERSCQAAFYHCQDSVNCL
jgi:hypothetical protein